MKLLERHTQLAELEAALRDAAVRHGSVVLVTGEAGAGKSSLVTQFIDALDRAQVYLGLCDELVTPRPLGPFRDMFGHRVRAMPVETEPGAVTALFDAMLEQLDRPPHPTVAVVEDAHWADAATLDAVRFLGRRIGRVRSLLVVTFRDDEVPADHPLRQALGAIPSADIRRVRLGGLSHDAVTRLAREAGNMASTDIAELFALTGGNPFFVSEVLASSSASVPATVQDAVMGRVARLSEAGRACVDVVSVVPGSAEWWLLEGCDVVDGVQEAVRAGVLRADSDTVSCRHELARRSVEQGFDEARRRDLNRRVLRVLADHDVDPARLTHHAARAGDVDAMVRFAPVAARRAVALDAHREAADHYAQALRHGDRYSADELAALLDESAHECHLAGRQEAAASVLMQAIDLHRCRGDVERLGADLSLLSDVHWYRGLGEETETALRQAAEALEQLPPGKALARSYAQRAKLHMVAGRVDEAAHWGDQAIGLAREVDDPQTVAQALISVGSARMIASPGDDRTLLDALELAQSHGLAAAAARAYHNLASVNIGAMRYDDAEPYLSKGLAFCEAHDLISGSNHLMLQRGTRDLYQGRWADAEHDLESVLTSGDVSRVSALPAFGLLQIRRGDPGAWRTLDEALRLVEVTRSVNELLLITASRAEAAWLDGRPEAVTITPAVETALAEAPRQWASGPSYWLHRTGAIETTRPDLIEPYASQVAGRWEEAARRWFDLGMPYEQAIALADASEPEPLTEALEILNRLGAAPLARKVRRRLVDMGVVSVPRGPRGETRANPAGLTARQTEVLRLLANGLSYREIADRLTVSTKTVDHHLAAVRAKLGVTNAVDAVEAGRRLGIIDGEHGGPRD